MKVKIKSFKLVNASNSVAKSISDNQILTTYCRIKALHANTGTILIGADDTQQFELAKGEELDITEIFEKDGGSADVDLQQIMMLPTIAGEGVCVIYADRNKAEAFRS